LEESGYPVLPDIRMGNSNKTKMVQSMLREYCLAHVHEYLSIVGVATAKIYFAGFSTGRKKVFIPWAKLVKNPSSFISEECTPNGFEWKDPSKIRIGEVFHLLYHWRSRQDQGLLPLVWILTCALFQDQDEPLAHPWNIRQPSANDSQDSNEENFVLPSFGECEDDDDAEHGGGSDSGSEHEDNSSSCGEPSNQSAEDSSETNHNNSNVSNSNPSDRGEPDNMTIDNPPITKPYVHQQISGMCHSF
jgi:hypothetical protein